MCVSICLFIFFTYSFILFIYSYIYIFAIIRVWAAYDDRYNTELQLMTPPRHDFFSHFGTIPLLCTVTIMCIHVWGFVGIHSELPTNVPLIPPQKMTNVKMENQRCQQHPENTCYIKWTIETAIPRKTRNKFSEPWDTWPLTRPESAPEISTGANPHHSMAMCQKKKLKHVEVMGEIKAKNNLITKK